MRRRFLMLAAGAALPLAVLLAVLISSDRDAATQDRLALANGPVYSFQEEFADPMLGEGFVRSEQGMNQDTPYYVAEPHDPAANDENTLQRYTDLRDRVAITFETGLLLRLERSQISDPAAEFAGLIANGSVPRGSRVVLIKDKLPALVIEPRTDFIEQNPASLQVIWNGISITLYHQDMSGDELVRIAESLR